MLLFFPSLKLRSFDKIDAEEDSSDKIKASELIKELANYFEDWLLPELAEDILLMIMKDESTNVPPSIKVIAFRVLHSKFSKNLSFETTIGESYHPVIISHLKELCSLPQENRLEVYK